MVLIVEMDFFTEPIIHVRAKIIVAADSKRKQTPTWPAFIAAAAGWQAANARGQSAASAAAAATNNHAGGASAD